MTRPLALDDLHTVELLETPAMAPDASAVVYVVVTTDKDSDSERRRLWIAATDTADEIHTGPGTARALTTGPSDTEPVWSPDGNHIAFVRTDDTGQQLCLLTLGTGLITTLTALEHGVGRPVWDPAGARIAFVAGVDRDPAVPAGTGDAPPSAMAHRPLVTDRLDYQPDGNGWRRGIRRQVQVLDLLPTPPDSPESDPASSETGLVPRAVRCLTDGDGDASTPAWSPDGSRLAFTADTGPDSDLTRTRQVFVIATDGQDVPQPVGPADGHLSSVQWIGDGSLLAGGRTDTRSGHDSLWRIDIDSGAIVDLTAALDRSIMRGGSSAYPGAPPQVVDDGRTILFCARDRGSTQLYAVSTEGGRPRLVFGGAGQVVAGMSVARDRIALVLITQDSFGEVVVVDRDGGGQRVLTAHGAGFLGIDRYVRVEREFVVSDGVRVHGWLLRDPGATGPQPLLLDIHGGPHNAWNGSADPVHLYHQVLAQRGWTILVLNPRASDGYGEEFFTATFGAWGAADLQDFLQPLDQLVSEGIADPDRLAVTGYSYGGFMTCYLTAHDTRFAAAVTAGPVTDLVSDCGTHDEGTYLSEAEFGVTWWSDPGPLRAASPLSAVSQVTTPTLILQGDSDTRCPKGQAQQWFSALRQRRVPTRLVLYPGASHGFLFGGRPSHRIDYQQRLIDWVDEYTSG